VAKHQSQVDGLLEKAMKLRKISVLRLKNSESGITLIELLVGLAVSGLIMMGVGMAFRQTIMLTVKSNNHLQAVRQLQNAGEWIVRDGQQAQPLNGVTVDTDPLSQELMTLFWDYSDYNGASSHTIIYALDGTVLTRQDNGGDAIALANNITSFEVNDTYSVTITATVGNFQQASETMTYYFKPRPS
jgi:type II secretory pathway pseudopilin PulG